MSKHTLNVQGIVMLPMKLKKATDDKRSYVSSVETDDGVKRLNQVKVLTKLGIEKPTHLDHIERVVPHEELLQSYDTGTELIPIDAKGYKNKFIQQTEFMTVMQIIPISMMSELILNGSNYFVSLQKDKSKTVPAEYKLLYTLLLAAMRETQVGFIVRYVGRSENIGLLYATSRGMQVSNLVPNNLIRTFSDEEFLTQPSGAEAIEFNQIQEGTQQFLSEKVSDIIDPEILEDLSMEKMDDIIQKLLKGEEVPDLPKPKAQSMTNLFGMLKQNLASQKVIAE